MTSTTIDTPIEPDELTEFLAGVAEYLSALQAPDNLEIDPEDAILTTSPTGEVHEVTVDITVDTHLTVEYDCISGVLRGSMLGHTETTRVRSEAFQKFAWKLTEDTNIEYQT